MRTAKGTREPGGRSRRLYKMDLGFYLSLVNWLVLLRLGYLFPGRILNN